MRKHAVQAAVWMWALITIINTDIQHSLSQTTPLLHPRRFNSRRWWVNIRPMLLWKCRINITCFPFKLCAGESRVLCRPQSCVISAFWETRSRLKWKSHGGNQVQGKRRERSVLFTVCSCVCVCVCVCVCLECFEWVSVCGLKILVPFSVCCLKKNERLQPTMMLKDISEHLQAE